MSNDQRIGYRRVAAPGGGAAGVHNHRRHEPPHQLPKKHGRRVPKHGHIITGKPFEDVKKHYTLGKELGSGQFGVTYLCTQNSTGLQYACKSIPKTKLVSRADKEDMRREIQIMQHLSGHSNIVEFKGTYEDMDWVHVVMELCAGGDLYDRIRDNKRYSERAAASICRQIVKFVQVCHINGVMHRDIKPENFLLSSKHGNALLKGSDFGLSVFIEEGKVYRDIVGSAFYVAPEVLRRSYGKEIDIWSAGVILYILLSGVPPFWAETEEGIFDAILQGHIDFKSRPWPRISSGAKDLVRKMLIKVPRKRITPDEALVHPWLKEGGNASDKPIDHAVLIRMSKFRAMKKLKKLFQKVVDKLFYKEVFQVFTSITTDESGTVTYRELKVGWQRLGLKLIEAEVQQLLHEVGTDENGKIYYLEFIYAALGRRRLGIIEELLYKAFQYIAKYGRGYITRDRLEKVMKESEMDDEATIRDIISAVDPHNDVRINYAEFRRIMRS
ncbi:hypothetical protein Fmac_030629 [Flemingia macrophylla]|uniref:non-specific serine/threonine protein kinase n=1 Tax=Flemingia macrophylla TaxID=520843 RepID=A0ABD1KZQ6_9FABA